MRDFTLSMIQLGLIVILFYNNSSAMEISPNKKENKLRIEWEKVTGATKYMVQIENDDNRLLIKDEVEDNYYDFFLPPGKYRIRIGAINKLGSIGSWSDWDEFTIERFKVDDDIYAAGVGMRIGFGGSYIHLLQYWSKIYKDSYTSGQLKLGFDFWNIKFLRQRLVNRYMGIDFDLIYSKYASKSSPSNTDSVLHNIIGGLNIYARTNFKFPINCILRIGSGITYSMEEYKKYNPYGINIGTRRISSTDPIFRTGLSLEIGLPGKLFVETGAEFIYIHYIDKGFIGTRGFLLFGFRV